MDRALPTAHLRRQRTRLLVRAALVVAGLVIALVCLQGWIEPSVKRGQIRTARVERGPVEASVSASGIVLPLVEQILTSPIDTRVVAVLQQPGATVEKDMPILQLDVSEARLAVATLDDQIALKRNEQTRTRLELESTLADLERRQEIKNLEARSLQYEATKSHTLCERGLIANDAVRKADTDAERATIELRLLTDAMAVARRSHAARDEGLELEMKILTKQRDEAAHVLQLATPAAERPGVLTWVLTGEGTAVRRGDQIARIADLSSFRVEATVSDVHAGRLASGMPATVQVGEARLQGTVGTVHPAVQDGAILFDIALQDPSDARLRSNLRVDVHAITASKPDALRIPRGTFGATDGSTWAFVVHGNHAVRTPIRLGLAGFETYEVVAGLAAGDEVIVSDTSDYMHHREVTVR